MCDCLNEPDALNEFLVRRITQLEAELDECQLRSIEARNPGIDIEEVRRLRAEKKNRMNDAE